MSLLARWLRPLPGGDLAVALRREWAGFPEPARRTPLDAQRFVVVDTETSGLDPQRDRLLAVAACAVQAGQLQIGEAMAARLRQERPSTEANVLIHGIGHGAQAVGERPEDALAAYLRFARRDPLVGYHTRFDLTVLQRAARAAFGISYRPPALDLALLMPALEAQGSGWELDQWLAHHSLRAFARHDALADAVAAGELFLIALERARSRGLCTVGELLRLQAQQLELARLAAH